MDFEVGSAIRPPHGANIHLTLKNGKEISGRFYGFYDDKYVYLNGVYNEEAETKAWIKAEEIVIVKRK